MRRRIAARPTSSDREDAGPTGIRPPCIRRPDPRGRRFAMAIGPVQLVVLGFNHPNFHGEILAELTRLRETGAVRVIDALFVYKDAAGELEAEHLGNMSSEETIELDSKIGALIGLGFDGDEGAAIGAQLGAEFAAEGGHLLPDEAAWDVLEEIPNDSAAALVLLEHHWA